MGFEGNSDANLHFQFELFRQNSNEFEVKALALTKSMETFEVP